MSTWVVVARVEEIPTDGFKVVNVDGTMVALFNLHGAYHAIDDVCTHDGGSLSGGKVQGEEIVCPRHGARFHIKNGAVTAPPAYEPLHVFPVRVRDGLIEVRDDRWD
ncbi:MAG TPA: non-heme iron oxygenase ferredoxin subunit [Candidatus Methylomirabilis sp.]|nr:non-heme iron oxygenase ferredoxin subunit [Candidatus Methylomirabilis sp.]